MNKVANVLEYWQEEHICQQHLDITRLSIVALVMSSPSSCKGTWSWWLLWRTESCRLRSYPERWQPAEDRKTLLFKKVPAGIILLLGTHLGNLAHSRCHLWNADVCVAVHSKRLPTPKHHTPSSRSHLWHIERWQKSVLILPFYRPDDQEDLCTDQVYWSPLCHAPWH